MTRESHSQMNGCLSFHPGHQLPLRAVSYIFVIAMSYCVINTELYPFYAKGANCDYVQRIPLNYGSYKCRVITSPNVVEPLCLEQTKTLLFPVKRIIRWMVIQYCNGNATKWIMIFTWITLPLLSKSDKERHDKDKHDQWCVDVIGLVQCRRVRLRPSQCTTN